MAVSRKVEALRYRRSSSKVSQHVKLSPIRASTAELKLDLRLPLQSPVPGCRQLHKESHDTPNAWSSIGWRNPWRGLDLAARL